jgi:hypothetical protein
MKIKGARAQGFGNVIETANYNGKEATVKRALDGSTYPG